MQETSPDAQDGKPDIGSMILVLRGNRLILDTHLASLYGTSTKRLNEQVKRNRQRFPDDFVVRLTAEETSGLMRSRIATASLVKRNARFRPFAFSEHGAIMAATLLNTDRAIAMSVLVVRTFVALRRLTQGEVGLARRLAEIETKLGSKLLTHEKALSEIFNVLRSLTEPKATRRRGIGFTAKIY